MKIVCSTAEKYMVIEINEVLSTSINRMCIERNELI